MCPFQSNPTAKGRQSKGRAVTQRLVFERQNRRRIADRKRREIVNTRDSTILTMGERAEELCGNLGDDD
jgi:hypothetical protein